MDHRQSQIMINYDELLKERNELRAANIDLRLRLSAIYAVAETIRDNIKIGFGNIERINHIISMASARVREDAKDSPRNNK